jgi:glycerophosphoryl diester phosphodiesterase
MARLDWLTARPIAHRGLHDAASGIVENTASAIEAAAAAGYGIEIDLQLTADGEAMVHHDEALGRLTEGGAQLNTLTAAALKAVPFKGTSDRMLTITELCALVAGRVTLLVELKSRLDGDRRLVKRAAEVLRSYSGPLAVMSFDPGQVEALKAEAPQLTRGLAAERRMRSTAGHATHAPEPGRYIMQAFASRPQFLAYSAGDLPSAPPLIGRNVLGLPLLTWTVRSAAEQARVSRWADQIIFEGFRP